MRTDTVYLPISIAKCVPLVHACPQSGVCARAIAKADKGRPLEDLSNSYIWTRGNCRNFIAAANFRDPPKDGPKPAHEPVKGLS